MSSEERALAGITLGISISESEAASGLGFSAREVNRAVREVAEAMLAQGVRVAFGHDWRPGGVMEEILSCAIDYTGGTDERGAMMMNFVPWPDQATLPHEERARYRHVLEINESGPPEVPAGIDISPENRDPAARLLALTEMRRRMTAQCDARLCIGGRVRDSQGRGAGIFEEAALAVEAGRALYVTGLFGGASAEVIRAVRGEDLEAPGVLDAPHDAAEKLEAVGITAHGGRYAEILRGASAASLAERNGLSPEQNVALFEAVSLTEVISLVLIGLSRLPPAS